MKRRWKILLGVLGLLAVLLAVNTVITRSQTKEAETTVDGARILELSSGDVQITDSGEAPGQPIVLIHPYAGSLHWYDRLEPLLAEEHRVIRIDLLGFGGSEKPETGYAITEQAATVAEALNQLDVQGALVVGNSMGGSVTTSLAEQASQLVDRAVIIGMAPNPDDFGPGLPFLTKLSYTPVIGEAMWRLTPDFAIRDQVQEAFAPGFDIESGFDDPDQVVEDYRAMTYTSNDETPAAVDEFADELPLDERFKRTPVPLMVIFGAEEQIFDPELAIEGYQDVPGVQTELVEDAGHAPQVEQPEAVASLINGFAVSPLEERAPSAGSDPSSAKQEKRRKGSGGSDTKGDRGENRKKKGNRNGG